MIMLRQGSKLNVELVMVVKFVAIEFWMDIKLPS